LTVEVSASQDATLIDVSLTNWPLVNENKLQCSYDNNDTLQCNYDKK